MTRKILLLWACLFFTPLLFCQIGYDVQVAVDTTKMRIGEKIEYTLQVKSDSTALIIFPEQPFFATFEVLKELMLVKSCEKITLLFVSDITFTLKLMVTVYSEVAPIEVLFETNFFLSAMISRIKLLSAFSIVVK